MLNERDSSSWKKSVGRVSPLVRCIETEPYQDEKDGGWMTKLYTVPKGMENAYGSPAFVGRSTITASSSSNGAEDSTLTNLSHSSGPSSSSNDSGIHEIRYEGLSPSYDILSI